MSPQADNWPWQPTLSGERLLLRPLREDDREALYAVASDRLIWEVHPAHDRWQRPVFDAFFDDALANKGAVAVIDRETDAMVGSSRWQYRGDTRDRIEIGWTFLARSHWGGRYNSELKRLMLAHALTFVPLVEFHVGAENWRSRRAMEKIGGVLTDRTDVTERGGVPVEHVIYAIDREAFANGPLAV